MADTGNSKSRLEVPELKTRAWFGLSFNLRTSGTIEVPGGIRMDLHYEESERPLRSYLPANREHEALSKLVRNAKLRSGNDWLFVSNRGVLTFDSRLTLAFRTDEIPAATPPVLATAKPPKPALVTARLRGKAALDLGGSGGVSGKAVFDALNECIKHGHIGVVVAITFDPPSNGFDEDAAPEVDYKALSVLGQDQFVGVGRALKGTTGLTEIDVFRVEQPEEE